MVGIVLKDSIQQCPRKDDRETAINYNNFKYSSNELTCMMLSKLETVLEWEGFNPERKTLENE